MSALLSSTEADAPVRFGRTRAVLAVLVVVGTLASLVANCARTLTNTDTYFHLRFGAGVPRRVVAAAPGQRQHVRDARLGARRSGCPRS